MYKKFKSIYFIDFNNYKNIQNQVTCEIRKSRKAEINNLAEKLENPNIGPKDWWNTLKRFIKPDQKSTIPQPNVDDVVYSDGVDKANKLNDFFTEQTVLDESNTSLPPLSDLPPFKFDSISVSSDEVTSVLTSLNIGKASGPDSINNRLLKELAQPLTPPLKDLFNYSLAIGKVPSIWKQANGSPIYKKDGPSVLYNYRPISLLSTVGKILERIVHKHIFNFFQEHHIITTLQSGFVPGDSTVNQLVDIYNTFCKALDDGKEVRAIFCEISKAFDRVWHKGLIYKLKTVGISGSVLLWFTDYLDISKQRVVFLPGACSNWTSVNAGVPQGSILHPLLFLLYINGIVKIYILV